MGGTTLMLLAGTPSDDVTDVLVTGDGDITTHSTTIRSMPPRRCDPSSPTSGTAVSRSRWGVLAPLIALTLLSGCAAGAGPSGESPTSPTSTAPPAVTTTTTAGAAAAPTTPPPVSKNWFDLDVGDCLADPPPVDPNVVTVTLVDCATAHQAEVYLREPLAVNTAIADVADRACGAGFVAYTGQPVGGTPFAVVYLIDSNQNRTSSNPNPSAVICLLTAADGTPLTGSARP